MPLSAQGVLAMARNQHHLYEVFEQVSLTNAPSTAAATVTSTTASPPSRVVCGAVVRPGSGSGGPSRNAPTAATGHAGKGVVGVIPTAQVVRSLPPSPALPGTSHPSLSSTPGDVVVGCVSAQGTLYVCELPERTWASIGAVTATSAPLQRQLAFTTEASAFGGSHNPSFTYGSCGPGGQSPVLPHSPETLETVLSAISHKDAAEELLGELRELGIVTDGSASFSPGGAGGGIQLPGLASPTDNGSAERFAMNGAPATAPGQPTHTSVLSPDATALEAGGSTMNGTVSVVLWVAVDAGTTTAGRGAAPSQSSLPGCVCFAVRDVADAKGNATELLSSRERRLQMLTLQLASGAAAYRTKSATDVFVLYGGGGPAAASAVTPRGGPCSANAASPGPSLTFSFVFHQGGISRCVAALRRQSPELVYARLGGRSDSSFTFSFDDGNTGTAGLRAPPPPSSSGAVLTGLLSPRACSERGAGEGQSMGSPVSGSDGTPVLHRGKIKKHGLRERLTAGARMIGSGSSGALLSVGGLMSHYASNFLSDAIDEVRDVGQNREGKSGTKNSARHDKGKGKRSSKSAAAAAEPGESPVTQRDHSSNSSFEDLTEELTALRMGAGHAPPRPSLPPLPATRNIHSSGAGSAPATSVVSAAEWEEVFVGHPKFAQTPARSPAAPSVSEHFPASDPATSTSSVSMTAMLADRTVDPERWRAFRHAVYERGGLADDSIRYEVWCYLLGAYAVGSSAAERAAVQRSEEALYARLTQQWKSFLPEQEAHFAAYRYAKNSIIKDVERTDRTHPVFREDDSAMLRVLRELLLGHVMLDMDLGYSQGMSDVASIAILATAPSSLLAEHASLATEGAMFLCYRKILSEHMSKNFIIEERKSNALYAAVAGLQRKLYQTQVLARHFHPGLYTHLKDHCTAEDMSFCFRWLLVCFKRDLPSIADTMRLWDVIFACPYTTSYEVVITVALLGALAPQIISHIHAYETLLQFFNTLNTSTTLDQILFCTREFYQNVCVAETCELRRRLRRRAAAAAAAEVADAAAAAAVARGEVLPGWYVGTHGKATAWASEAFAATREGAGIDEMEHHYPTVEEMVELFLKTDGPL